jgi:hypothetical protein
MRKELKSLDNYQLVIPEVMVETLHQLYHDSPMAGHVGIHETLHRMSEHCLWFLILIDFLFLVFNVTFSNISVISWRPVLVVEKAVLVIGLYELLDPTT